jgi:hypothetical protein
MLRVGMLSGDMDGVMLRGVMPCDAMLLFVVRGVVQLLVPDMLRGVMVLGVMVLGDISGGLLPSIHVMLPGN